MQCQLWRTSLYLNIKQWTTTHKLKPPATPHHHHHGTTQSPTKFEHELGLLYRTRKGRTLKINSNENLSGYQDGSHLSTTIVLSYLNLRLCCLTSSCRRPFLNESKMVMAEASGNTDPHQIQILMGSNPDFGRPCRESDRFRIFVALADLGLLLHYGRVLPDGVNMVIYSSPDGLWRWGRALVRMMNSDRFVSPVKMQVRPWWFLRGRRYHSIKGEDIGAERKVTRSTIK